MGKYRIVIVGAGIVGASIARVLSAYENLEVYLLEREADVGWGISKANTSIIHPCHEEDPRRHPLRARLCVEGNRVWREWVKELDIPVKFPGELMLLFNDEEVRSAAKYIELARINGVPEVRLITDTDELVSLEPNISEKVVGAVWAPTAGLINPVQAVIALVENAVSNGVKLMVETEVKGVRIEGGGVRGVETSRGFISADIVINAAGIYADKVSYMAGIKHFKIRPRKGEYYIFDPLATPKVRRIIHPIPTPISKGVYVLTTTEGNLMIGPSAKDLPEEAREDRSTTSEGLNYVWREAKRLVRRLPPKHLIMRSFAGLRPEPSTGDFIIEAYTKPWGFVNVAGIRSPGLTAAPAIAYYVMELLKRELGIELKRKSSWNPRRRGITRIKGKSWSEVKRLVRENPLYGWIICRDEVVSAAEILEAVKRIREIGAKVTLDGIKFRTWAMMGRCQGSFCRLPIALLLRDYAGISITEISIRGKGTEYVLGDVKALWRERIRGVADGGI